jgi:hypothetical protein
MVGAMGGMTSQLANGVRLAVRFIIASDSLKSNSSEVFPDIGSWRRSPLRHRPRRFRCIFSLLPQWQAVADLSGRGPFQNDSTLPSNSQQRNSQRVNEKGKQVTVKIPAHRFIAFILKGTDKIMRSVNPFYIQKTLDAIAGILKNSSRLKMLHYW